MHFKVISCHFKTIREEEEGEERKNERTKKQTNTNEMEMKSKYQSHAAHLSMG